MHLPTDTALDTARRLVAWLRAGPVSHGEVVGHVDIAVADWATVCPGATWDTWRSRIV